MSSCGSNCVINPVIQYQQNFPLPPLLVRATHLICRSCNNINVSEYGHTLCYRCATISSPEFLYHHSRCLPRPSAVGAAQEN